MNIDIQEWYDMLNEKYVRTAYASVWYGQSKPTMKAGERAFEYLTRMRGGEFVVASTKLVLDRSLEEDSVECESTIDGWLGGEKHVIRIKVPQPGL